MSQDLTSLQEAVLARVKRATRREPITGADLIKSIQGATDDAKKKGANMRAVINALWTKGYPICANDAGYYWPQTVEQINEFVAQLDGRIAAIQRARAGMVDGITTFKIPTAAEAATQAAVPGPENMQLFDEVPTNRALPSDEFGHLRPDGSRR